MSRNISDTLKSLRLAAGFTQKQVYEMLNIPQSTFSSWETGKSEPSADMLLRLCHIYGVEDVFAAFGYDRDAPSAVSQLTEDEWHMVENYRLLPPVGRQHVDMFIEWEMDYAGQSSDTSTAVIASIDDGRRSHLHMYSYFNRIAAAGMGFYFDDIPTDTIEAPYCQDADFIIGVNGDSMEPTYFDGDLLYVRKCQTVPTGEVGIFILDGACLIKEAGENGLISHNPKYSTIPGSDRIICVGQILGKVNMKQNCSSKNK